MATHTADSEAVVRRFIDDGVDGRDYDLIEELFTNDYARHDPVSPESEGGPGPRIESLRQLHRTFPDSEVHVGEVAPEGDLVAFEGTMTGAHEGAFMGVEPTGIEIEIQGNAMHRVGVGRIAETWATWDFLGLLQQIGAVDQQME